MHSHEDTQTIKMALQLLGEVRVRLHHFSDSHWLCTVIITPHQQRDLYLVVRGCTYFSGSTLCTGTLHVTEPREGEVRVQTADESLVIVGSELHLLNAEKTFMNLPMVSKAIATILRTINAPHLPPPAAAEALRVVIAVADLAASFDEDNTNDIVQLITALAHSFPQFSDVMSTVDTLRIRVARS